MDENKIEKGDAKKYCLNDLVDVNNESIEETVFKIIKYRQKIGGKELNRYVQVKRTFLKNKKVI